MSNRLTQLLSTPTLSRKSDDYEEMYDDFVTYAGGTRVSVKFDIPDKTRNADYHFYLNEREILLELKQVTKYERDESVDHYFLKELKKGKIKRLKKSAKDKIEIGPDSLSNSEWNKFYKNFRPSISTNLKKAANQLRDTDRFLPPAKKPRIKGVILINTNDYNLSTDLMYRLVEWKLKREWKMGCFKSIDFVSCTTIDMYKEIQHPLYSRHIARTTQDADLISGIKYIYERWIYYSANALGMEVEKKSNNISSETQEVDLNTPYVGKIFRKQ